MELERGLVVIVEDERAIAELERRYLSDAGFGVHVSPDGRSGLADIRRLSPVAAVIDVGLPASSLVPTTMWPSLSPHANS